MASSRSLSVVVASEPRRFEAQATSINRASVIVGEAPWALAIASCVNKMALLRSFSTFRRVSKA